MPSSWYFYAIIFSFVCASGSVDYYVYKAEAVSDLVGLRATRMASIAYLLLN